MYSTVINEFVKHLIIRISNFTFKTAHTEGRRVNLKRMDVK
jgi:hypothetical protein